MSISGSTLVEKSKTLSFVRRTRGNRWGGLRRILGIILCTSRAVTAIMRSEKAQGGVRQAQEARHLVMIAWAREAMEILGVQVTTLGRAHDQPCLLIGNHSSYLDIPLMMAVTPTVFVAKAQLKSWPVFGKAMVSVGTVFVERESRHSRKGAAEAIAPSILNEKQSVTIFPSGTTTIDEVKPWRWGAFVIAKRYGIPIQPVRIRYTPARTAAFIGQDLFLTHLWRLATCPGGVQATVEFADPIVVTDPQADALKWWQWCKEGL